MAGRRQSDHARRAMADRRHVRHRRSAGRRPGGRYRDRVAGDAAQFLQFDHRAPGVAGASLPLSATALTQNPASHAWMSCGCRTGTRRISADSAAFFHVLIYGVSIILAIGAMFGCFNTMYAAVETRGAGNRHLAGAGLWKFRRRLLGHSGSIRLVGCRFADRRR